MKLSLGWLKDYVDFDLSVEQLVHRLTMAGLEVEKIESRAGDTVIELEVTPNRPDCLNVIGLAREVAAILGKPLKLPLVPELVIPKKKCEITIDDKDGCSRYIGTLIENVNVEPSPEWLAQRLNPLGGRLINNIVDITNFCLFEYGQPLHAFDFDKLIGGRIIVRRAKRGEKIVTIDGVERTLDPSILVIADAQRPVAIAGIMGGKDTEVTETTKNVLLESAYFDSVLTRRAGRQLGLGSDASYRFERGVDWPTVATGAARAVALILETAGGAVSARNDLVLAARRPKQPTVKVSSESVNSLLGVNLPIAKIQTSLKRLGFTVKADGKQLAVTPPSFRGDIKRDVDVIEEIARMIGYDQLPTSMPQIKFFGIPRYVPREVKKSLRCILTGQGLNEIITYSLISRDLLEKAHLEGMELIRVQNPLSQEQEILRPAVLPSFLNVARTNFSRGEKNLRLFEIGKIYPPSGEREILAVLLSGARARDWRVTTKDKVDFYDLKGIVEAVAARAALSGLSLLPSKEKIFDAGETADVILQGKKIGSLGKIASDILAQWDIKNDDVFFAQMDLEEFFKVPAKKKRYQAFSEYPAMVRDVSLAIPNNVSFARVKETVIGVGAANLTAIVFKEQYIGEKIPAGQRGITFSLLFQSAERTLTEEEVQQSHACICQALVEKIGAVVR